MRLLLFTAILLFFNQSWALKASRIIIDPGHGGNDNGAVYHGAREADINLKVGKLLNHLLKSDRRFIPFMTRTQDKHVSLEERSEFAHNKDGDIFISLHANSFHNSQPKGAEFYFQNQLPPDEEAMYLANKENSEGSKVNHDQWPLKPVRGHKKVKHEVSNIIQNLQLNYRILLSSKLAEALNMHWQGNRRVEKHSIKQAPFHVISNVSMPSSLIELGYLTNKSEAQKLKNRKYQQRVADSLYMGLIKYKEFIDKSLINDLN